jgi:hypothetical protein
VLGRRHPGKLDQHALAYVYLMLTHCQSVRDVFVSLPP